MQRVCIAICALLWSAAALTESLAIVGIDVVPMDRNRLLRDHTVLIRDGLIAAIGPSRTTSVAADVRRIDGRGRYLLPGLADMHVHFVRPAAPAQSHQSASSDYVRENEMLAAMFVANGVTSVRNMWGDPAILALARDIDAARTLGPRIFSAGPITDGSPVRWAGSRAVTTRADAEAAVAEDLAAGYISLKVYGRLSADAYEYLASAAKARGLPFVGHVPFAVPVQRALAAGQHSIEHLEGYVEALQPDSVSAERRSSAELLARADLSRLPALVRQTVASSAWNCPTLILSAPSKRDGPWRQNVRLMPPALIDRYEAAYPAWGVGPSWSSEFFALKLAIVKALHEAGAPLVLGTDTYKPTVLPGFSAHEELAYLVQAGLSPYDALRAGTVDAARLVGRDDFGTIEVGKRADLLVLTGNPLRDIRETAHPVGVVLAGRWIDPQELWLRLQRQSP